jgi:predicted O-methyltransferase YrrM
VDEAFRAQGRAPIGNDPEGTLRDPPDAAQVPSPSAVSEPAWTTLDLHAWAILAPLASEYIPWSTAAMRPSGLVAVLNDLHVLERRTVVECGAGISTLFIARALERLGHGHLTTLEHDSLWAAATRRQLAREGLTGRATIVEAPLAPHPLSWDGDWYAEAALARGLPAARIDLLLVDGPPAHEPALRHARYPALPVLRDRLAPDCTVALDDAGRSGEQEVLERWEAETDLRFERRPDHGGIAIARPPGHDPLGV